MFCRTVRHFYSPLTLQLRRRKQNMILILDIVATLEIFASNVRRLMPHHFQFPRQTALRRLVLHEQRTVSRRRPPTASRRRVAFWNVDDGKTHACLRWFSVIGQLRQFKMTSNT
jgi:hypothetical protein